MAKKKKPTLLKKFLIVAIVLVVVQTGLIIFFRTQKNSTSFVESAEEALSQTAGITDRRALQAKIQIAVLAYKKAEGSLPTALHELRPKYLDSIPNDPDTQQPFTYQVDGARFYVGKTAVAKSAPEAPSEMTISPEQANFVYDATGKRDPFRPFDIAPKVDDASKTPLERYDLGQFKLTAVLSSLENPSATVELSDGKGFIVRKGTKIGLNGGEVIDIQPGKVVILETKIDFTGQKSQQTIEMLLRLAEPKK